MKSFKIFNGTPFIIVLQSLLIAFYADIKCINWSLVYGGFTSEGTMSLLYLVIVALIFSFSILGKNKLRSRFNIIMFGILLWLLGFYYYTQFFIGPPHTQLPMFMIFVIIAMLLPYLVRIDAKYFIKGIIFFPFFAIFRLNLVFSPVSNWTDAISMDASYAFLVPITATIVYLFLYFKDESKLEKIFTLILSFINFVYLWKILQYGSRGPLLSITLLIFFLLIFKTSEKGASVRSGSLSLIILGGLMLILTFSASLPVINQILQSSGISIHAIDKIIRLSGEGNITNGRDMINAITWSGFMDSPLFGHGLDRFDANTSLLYPHNFILQILYDGGIILFLVLLVPMLKASIRIMKTCTKDEYAVFVVLFFSSVPGALFSGDMWGLARLWLFFGFVLSKSFVIKKPSRISIHNYNKISNF